MKLKRLIKILSLSIVLSHLFLQCTAAVWQWSVPVKDENIKNSSARAYLWIPENCHRINAFIFAQNNMEEQSILENEIFRNKMSNLGIAEIWVSPAYDLRFDFSKGAGNTFDAILNDLAEISGYMELRSIPFIGMGHSAAASAPYYMAAWAPERTVAAISVSGQWPYFRDGKFAPDIWKDKNIDFIPCLETMGEYEAASSWSKEGLRERQEHPYLPLSMLACPGEGHFAATQSKIDFIAFYIKKAFQLRMPPKRNGKLVAIDPTKVGWLAEKWKLDQLPSCPPGPVSSYSGNRADAFWFFDEETALMVQRYQASFHKLKVPLVGYLQNRNLVQQTNTHQQINLKFEPLPDGVTFRVQTKFYESVPDGSPRPPVWSQKSVGQTIDHPFGAAIQVNRITGPIIKVDDSTFKIQAQTGFYPSPHSYEAWFAATYNGDKEFKPAVQQALMPIPPRNLDGQDQHITFLPLRSVDKSKKILEPIAISDRGMQVSFYIADGPAEFIDGLIHIRKVPPAAKYPVRITVIAWQYARGSEPKIKPAEPVEQVFWINKR